MTNITENREIFNTATEYIKAGLSIIPIPFKEKGAAIKWEEYQRRQPNDTELQTWFNNSHESNMAVVCGTVSHNLVVLDCDSEEKFWELAAIICEKRNIDDIFEWTPIVKTGKGFHIYLRTEEPVKSKKFPALDIKAEGGYVIAPPSIHPSGAQYSFVAGTFFTIREIKCLKEIGIDIDQPAPGQRLQVTEGQKIPKGQQNDWLFRRASSYRRQGDTEDLIFQKLKIDVLRCDQDTTNPFTDKDLLNISHSSAKYLPLTIGTIGLTDSNSPFSTPPVSKRDKSVTEIVTKAGNDPKSVTRPLAELITEWVKETSSWFSYEDLDKDLGITQPTDKDNRRQIIKRLKTDKILEVHPSNNKLLRFINEETITVNYKLSHTVHPMAIKFPLGIEEYFNFYSKNIVVVAGSPDAGKTAWLLNFIKLNQKRFQIFYQSSEMGQDELAVRLRKFNGISLDDWTFVAEERSSNFHDVIRPDDINIIDYMELTSEPYMVAEYLRKIHDRLNKGVAIVALQKKRGAELGRGAEFSLEKPRLYLGMDSGQMTIQKCKNWASEENPNKMITKFKIVSGCEFHVTESWHKPEEE